MDAVTNFTLSSKVISNDLTSVLFSFRKPTRVSGYRLYRSTDGVTYSVVSIKSDIRMQRAIETSTYDDAAGFTYFSFGFDASGTEGNRFYFYITAVSEERSESVPSDIISVYTYPSAVTGITASYDGYQIALSFTGVDTLLRNHEFKQYNIEKWDTLEITGSTLTEGVLFHPDFILGTYVIVQDTSLKTTYGGLVTKEGEFEFAKYKFGNISDVSNVIPNYYVLKCYKINACVSSAQLGSATTTTWTDANPDRAALHLYRVCTENTASDISTWAYYPVFTYPVSGTFPYIRNLNNSGTALLADTSWKYLKAALVGTNFYKKGHWAIPYSAEEAYSIRGYCGVANCKVDVFINDILDTSLNIVSDALGNFNIVYKFPKGSTKLYVQLRDYKNIQFSEFSAVITVETLYTYSWFAAMSEQYGKILEKIQYVVKGVSIENTDYAQFSDNYQPLIELIKDGVETSTESNPDRDLNFNIFAKNIFKSFNDTSFALGLTELLDAFGVYLPEIERTKVYYNNSLNNTFTVPRAYIAKSFNLARNIYTYKVTAVLTSSRGEQESAGMDCLVDTRYLPQDFRYYTVLKWPQVLNASFYRVYRKRRYNAETNYTPNTDGYLFLAEAQYNIFADNGLYAGTTAHQPPEYNFSALTEVPTLQSVSNLCIAKYNNAALRKVHWLNIIVFMKDASELSSLNFKRLIFYINKLLPPEKNYTLTVCNNIGSTVYNSQGIQISAPYISTTATGSIYGDFMYGTMYAGESIINPEN